MAFDSGCESIAGRLGLIGLDADARARLAATAKAMDAATPAMIGLLHDHLRAFPETAEYFHNHEQVERLAGLQCRHILRLLEGDAVAGLDEDRNRIGATHHRLGVSPRLYVGAYALILRAQAGHVLTGSPDPAAALDAVAALIGLALVDAGIVLDAYGLLADHAVRAPAAAHLASDDIGRRRRFLQIDATTEARVRELAPILTAALPEVLAECSEAMRAHLQIPAVMTPATVARLTSASATFWHELTVGRFDRLHASSCVRVGVVHDRVGVSLPFYLAGLACQLGRLVRAMPAEHPDLVDLVDALLRAVFFDVTYVVDAYVEARTERLLRAEGHAEALAAHMIDAVVVVDEHNRIESANEQFLPFVRADPGVLPRMRVDAAFAMPELIGLVEHVRNSTDDRHSMLTRSGERIQGITAIRLDVRDDPGRGAVALVLSDMTELIRLAEAAPGSRTRLDDRIDAPVPAPIGVTVDVGELQAHRLDQERAIGNLASGVAHELSNALSAIYGHLAVLGRLVHDPRAQRSLAAAEGAAARAADITARLLSFAGRQALESGTVDLNDVVREVVPAGAWPTGRVEVEHHLEPALAPCHLDRARVAASLGELVVNALEAMPRGGVLRVSTANVAGPDGAEQVEVAVADVGRGMTAEELARAIEPFYTTKSVDEGAGLGLSTVYGFVSQSGGVLLLESVEGAGTIVRMRFPSDRLGAIEETIAIGAPAPTGRVLLVDVDPMMREVTGQILSMLGLAVTTADSLGAAHRAIDAGEFDFLVTEATLGGHDGLAFAADMVERRPALGAVVMSGVPAVQLDLTRLRGRCELVAKPFSLTTMARALRDVGWTGPAGSSIA